MTTSKAVATMTNEEYHAAPAVSSSGIVKLIQGTPAHYRAYLTEKREVTPAMELGTAIHAAVLEPEEFAKNYAFKPAGMNFATTEGKVWKAAHANFKILSQDDLATVRGIVDSLNEHPVAAEVIANGQKEQSFFWVDKETGIACKCRPDVLLGKNVFDVKTTQDASPRGFQRNIMTYGMHLQSAWYLDGLSQIMGEPLTNFVHIAVEKSAPYAVGLYVLDDASLERARLDIRKALQTIADCEAKGQWPAYSSEVKTMNLPAWAWGENE